MQKTRAILFSVLSFAAFVCANQAQAQTPTLVTFEPANVSADLPVLDRNGREIGRYPRRGFVVAVPDSSIASSVNRNGRGINASLLMQGVPQRNAGGRALVRISPQSYSGFRPTPEFARTHPREARQGPAEAYVPLNDILQGRYRPNGLAGGANTTTNRANVRFLNALPQASGLFVQPMNRVDPHQIPDPDPQPRTGQRLRQGEINVFPPTCGRTCGCRVTSTFGPRCRPAPGASTNHQAMDIGGAAGTSLRAPDRVRVSFVGRQGGYGNRVEMISLTRPGVKYAFSHLDGFDVSNGAVLEPGQPVGRMGRTGVATGVHLHFEMYRQNASGNYVREDPLPYIGVSGRNLRLVSRNSCGTPDVRGNDIFTMDCNELLNIINSSRGGSSTNRTRR